MGEAERENEIHQIEEDLRNLQRRHATLERSARRMRISFYVLVFALVVGVLAALILENLMALVFSGFMLIVVGAYAYALKDNRWIDIASGPWGYAAFAVKYIEAQAIEDMVAERMERLARLKRNYR